MLHICCVRAGEAFSPAYVSILYDMVRRNLGEGFEGEFVCFTDQPDELEPGIVKRPLPAALPGWWSKIALHKRGVFPDGDRVLFLDLDTLITGRLDEIASYDGSFAILRDFYRPDGLQSAVMAWEAGTTSHIWDSYEAAGCPQDDERGDQAWIERSELTTAVRLQDRFPGLFVSYKQIKGPPDRASVVCFHGLPRPHEVTDGWVPQVWKLGGMTRADLDTVCNTERERLLANVRASCARDLEWLDTAPEHDGHVVIVGGGPSLKDTVQSIRWRAEAGQKVWALNGAGQYLISQGIIPDAIVMADARPENTWLLPQSTEGVEFLLASQCAPQVFDALARAKVTLWHVNAPGTEDFLSSEKGKPVHLIGGGSTVGLNAMVIAFARGIRKIHLYGFDSSYRESEHHAYAQAGNDGDRVIDALYGDAKFKTTAWMAQQVNEFQDLVPALASDGCIISVGGDGLLPTVARDLQGKVPLTAADIRAAEVLDRLGDVKAPRGAEIGVFAGDMSVALLRNHPGLHLDLVDSWEGGGAAYTGDSGDWHASLAQETQEAFMLRALDRTAFAKDRATVLRGRSVEVAGKVPDEFYDFVFIDADHSYEGCSADIAAWLPKVKAGGLFGGHDYENTDFEKFGVKRAVDEFVAANGLKLDLGDNFTWFVRKEMTHVQAA